MIDCNIAFRVSLMNIICGNFTLETIPRTESVSHNIPEIFPFFSGIIMFNTVKHSVCKHIIRYRSYFKTQQNTTSTTLLPPVLVPSISFLGKQNSLKNSIPVPVALHTFQNLVQSWKVVLVNIASPPSPQPASFSVFFISI